MAPLSSRSKSSITTTTAVHIWIKKEKLPCYRRMPVRQYEVRPKKVRILRAFPCADGRLFITFRSIERGKEKVRKYADKGQTWFSEGWVAWVGTYEDLKSGSEGQYRIKLAHTYRKNQSSPDLVAEADTGYCGNVVLNDGTVVTSTYGAFGERNSDGGYKTYVASKRIRLSDVDRLIK